MFLLIALGLSLQTKRVQTRFAEKQLKNETMCDLCNQLVQYVKDLVSSASVEEEIKDFLDGYCATLKWPTKDICKKLVKSYLPTIIKMVEDEIDSLHICQTIGFCNATSKVARKARIPHKKEETPMCDICEKIVEIVDVLLDNQTIEEEIEQMALQYCNDYKWPVKNICKSAIKKYLPSFISYLEAGIKPFEVCQKVGLCEAATISHFQSEEGCQTCQKWFKWAEDKLDEVTVEGLWKLISEECPKVPYLKYFCQIINEQNIETFVSLILSALPPEQCCQWIKVC